MSTGIERPNGNNGSLNWRPIVQVLSILLPLMAGAQYLMYSLLVSQVEINSRDVMNHSSIAYHPGVVALLGTQLRDSEGRYTDELRLLRQESIGNVEALRLELQGRLDRFEQKLDRVEDKIDDLRQIRP